MSACMHVCMYVCMYVYLSLTYFSGIPVDVFGSTRGRWRAAIRRDTNRAGRSLLGSSHRRSLADQAMPSPWVFRPNPEKEPQHMANR